MRMVENTQQMPVGSYRVTNDHNPNVIVENLGAEKTITDEDDDDPELLGDGEISSRLGLCRSNSGEVNTGPHNRLENDKRLRREIANSNERRRMQSINAGFQSLKALLPRRDGEKMSKASILQQTADFIRTLQSERDALLQQSNELKQIMDIGSMKSNRQSVDKIVMPSCIPKTEFLHLDKRHCVEYGIAGVDTPVVPPKKRRKFENDSADEGLGMLSDAEAMTIPRTSPGHRLRPVVKTAIAFTQTDPPVATVEASCCTSPPQHINEPKSVESSLVHDKLWEIEMLQRQLIELRLALDRERRVRLMLEDQMRITELNRLQTLARLQTVPLVEYNMPPTTGNAGGYSCPTSSPRPIVRTGSPSLLRPLSTTSDTAGSIASIPAVNNAPPAPPTSLHSLSDSVLRLGPAVSQPSAEKSPLPAAPVCTVDVCHRLLTPAPATAPKQPAQSNSTNNGPLYKSSSSKQSLAAIVEAIRHLEGDQLFVDVELQRPADQQQSVMANAAIATTAGDQTAVSSTVGTVTRPDYTDSGISSPVSERHVTSGAASNSINMAGHGVGNLLVSGINEVHAGAEMNHVVAATAAALHNLCFPYTSPQNLNVMASSHNTHRQSLQ